MAPCNNLPLSTSACLAKSCPSEHSEMACICLSQLARHICCRRKEVQVWPLLICGHIQCSTTQASGECAVSSCFADTGGIPTTSGGNLTRSGATPSTSGAKIEEQDDAESLEDREFRQAVQARRKSPLDTSSSYRSTASSDDSSDPDNPAHSPDNPADKANWQNKQRTGRQLQQHSSRLVHSRAPFILGFTANVCTN